MSANNNKNDNIVVGAAQRLARRNILELQPYRCARDDYSDGILLDANENALGAPIRVENEMALERYPDPYQIPLKELLCQYRNGQQKTNSDNDDAKLLTPANVFVGVGSDEAIDLLFRIFCDTNESAMITPPTYGMYQVCAKINNVPIIRVPLTPTFDLEVPEILQAITPATKLIFLCSPGNPTSKTLPLSDIRAILDDPKSRQSIVVVDEAYIDFADSESSAVGLIHEYDNVVVLQTMSKAFGLAAIRCGFCLGPPDVIQLLNNVKAPYNVNQLTSELALRTFREGLPQLQSNIAVLLEQRTWLAAQLEALAFVTKVYPSDANFILFRLQKNAQAIYTTMANRGVVTRYRGHELHCDECIRVTVGTPDENKKFLELIQSTYAELDA